MEHENRLGNHAAAIAKLLVRGHDRMLSGSGIDFLGQRQAALAGLSERIADTLGVPIADVGRAFQVMPLEYALYLDCEAGRSVLADAVADLFGYFDADAPAIGNGIT